MFQMLNGRLLSYRLHVVDLGTGLSLPVFVQVTHIGTKVNVTGLLAGHQYYAEVTTVTTAGLGTFSPRINFTAPRLG